MRQIEKEIRNALLYRNSRVFSNTVISVSDDKVIVNLHDSVIAKITNNEVVLNFHKYDTNVTRNRLNIVAKVFLGGEIRKVKGVNKLFIGDEVTELSIDKENAYKMYNNLINKQ